MVPLGVTFRKAYMYHSKGTFLSILLGKWFGLFFRQMLQFCFVFNYEKESLFPQTLNICAL